MDNRWKNYFIKSAIIFLFCTGAAKIWSSAGSSTILNTPSPIFDRLTNRELLLASGILEVLIAAFLLQARKSEAAKLKLIAWIASLFISYRVGLVIIGYNGYCTCLGKLIDLFSMSPAVADAIALTLAIYLGGGSVFFLWWDWRCSEKKSDTLV